MIVCGLYCIFKLAGEGGWCEQAWICLDQQGELQVCAALCVYLIVLSIWSKPQKDACKPPHKDTFMSNKLQRKSSL